MTIRDRVRSAIDQRLQANAERANEQRLRAEADAQAKLDQLAGSRDVQDQADQDDAAEEDLAAQMGGAKTWGVWTTAYGGKVLAGFDNRVAAEAYADADHLAPGTTDTVYSGPVYQSDVDRDHDEALDVEDDRRWHDQAVRSWEADRTLGEPPAGVGRIDTDNRDAELNAEAEAAQERAISERETAHVSEDVSQEESDAIWADVNAEYEAELAAEAVGEGFTKTVTDDGDTSTQAWMTESPVQTQEAEQAPKARTHRSVAVDQDEDAAVDY